MKRLVLVIGGIFTGNLVANIVINAFCKSGGTLKGAAFIALPYLAPAPLNHKAAMTAPEAAV